MDRKGPKLPDRKPGLAKRRVKEKKAVITEFEDMEDWVLSMVIVAVMHATPGIKTEEAVKVGRQWSRKLHMPRTEHLWNRQRIRIDRIGLRAEASKIRREMYKLI